MSSLLCECLPELFWFWRGLDWPSEPSPVHGRGGLLAGCSQSQEEHQTSCFQTRGEKRSQRVERTQREFSRLAAPHPLARGGQT